MFWLHFPDTFGMVHLRSTHCQMKGSRMTPEKYYRLPELRALVPLSRSSIYEMMSKGKFPKPVKLTSKVVAWKSSDIAAWLAEREQAA